MDKSKDVYYDVHELLEVIEDIHHITDIDALLDRILFEARRFTHSDAGSIYLVEGNRLRFSYVQNDSLFKEDIQSNKYLYTDQALEINERSIAGYVAMTGTSLVIDNAYEIPPDVPYSFNISFDRETSYHTQSILTTPLRTSQDTLVGVLQIINKLDGEDRGTAFSKEDELWVSFFSNSATSAIERAKLTREIILRMIRMAELRDPKETGAHVNRVGAYSIEMYQEWARKHGIPEQEIRRVKDNLRIAAMLHDVGKVAISDTILKKPGKLDSQEYDLMKMHTIMGTRLFRDTTSDLDSMSAEICLNHHERWDGTGYPGSIEDMYAEHVTMGEGKKEYETSLAGRIVALADVYDALISKRTYKDAWQEGDVLRYIEEQSGKQFDPEIVHVFLSIYDVIRAIREKFKDR